MSPWVLNQARETGGAVARVADMLRHADHPQAILAYLDTIGRRQAVGTVEALEEIAVRQAYADAEARVTEQALRKALREGTTAEKLAALDEDDVAGLAQLEAIRARLATNQAIRERLLADKRKGQEA